MVLSFTSESRFFVWARDKYGFCERHKRTYEHYPCPGIKIMLDDFWAKLPTLALVEQSENSAFQTFLGWSPLEMRIVELQWR